MAREILDAVGAGLNLFAWLTLYEITFCICLLLATDNCHSQASLKKPFFPVAKLDSCVLSHQQAVYVIPYKVWGSQR